ncbi:hypothetical protein GCM10027278_27560 [Paralcaligenes ginsengisoli]
MQREKRWSHAPKETLRSCIEVYVEAGKFIPGMPSREPSIGAWGQGRRKACAGCYRREGGGSRRALFERSRASGGVSWPDARLDEVDPDPARRAGPDPKPR